MARRPNELSERPNDGLADTLGISLLGRARYHRIEARAPWAVRMRGGEGAVFYVVARGLVRLELDGHAPVTASAGDLVFLPRGSAHALRDVEHGARVLAQGTEGREGTHVRTLGGDGAATSIVVGAIDLSRRPTLLARMDEVVVSRLADADDAWLSATAALLALESESQGRASTKILQRLADVLFLRVLRSLVPPPSCQRAPNVKALTDPVVERALHLIHTRLHQRWTLPMLARQTGVSRSALAARFRALVGEPPLTYLARWRTTHAAKLLSETDDPIALVAERVGYESVPSFAKAFKRWQGTSPGAHRRSLTSIR